MASRRGATTTSPKRSDNDYIRIADIASGGVGHVALALRREGSFERLYAVKRLRAEHREDEDFRTMFFDEARIAGYVRHANVVSVLDVGEDEDGPFLVMDYVEGIPLSALVKHAQRSGTEVPLQVALRIAMETARGLHAAHELLGPDGKTLGLVHRDVSPQNILVGFDGVTRVTDFGVAKAFGRTTRTVTGVLKGKLGYMAPEQLRFEPVDRRTDLFALGVVLYELLVGGRLYRSVEEYDGVRRILEEPPPDLGDSREDAPPRLVELVFSLLAKRPDQRPASALEVARVLDEVLTDVEATDGKLDVSEYVCEAFAVERELQSSRARLRPLPSEPPLAPAQVQSSKRGVVALLALGALLAVGVGVAFVVGSRPAEQVAPPAVASREPSGAEGAVASSTLPSSTQPSPSTPSRAQVAAEPTPEEPSSAQVAADPSSTEPSPAESPRRRTTRRVRRAEPAERGGTSVPQWDWQ